MVKNSMASVVPKARVQWSYDDYCELPSDGNRYEIIDGELYVSPSPSVIHQVLSARLLVAFAQQIDHKKLGIVLAAPTDVILSPSNVVQPDLVVVATEHRDRITERAIEAAPDLVVEILSPNNRKQDVITKFKLYASFGVREYWIVDPELEEIKVFTLRYDGFVPYGEYRAPRIASSSIFADVRIETAALFHEP